MKKNILLSAILLAITASSSAAIIKMINGKAESSDIELIESESSFDEEKRGNEVSKYLNAVKSVNTKRKVVIGDTSGDVYINPILGASNVYSSSFSFSKIGPLNTVISESYLIGTTVWLPDVSTISIGTAFTQSRNVTSGQKKFSDSNSIWSYSVDSQIKTETRESIGTLISLTPTAPSVLGNTGLIVNADNNGLNNIIDLASGITDANGDALTITVSQPVNGSITDNLDGTYSYKSDGTAGNEIIAYSVTDGSFTTNGTFEINTADAGGLILSLNEALIISSQSSSVQSIAKDSWISATSPNVGIYLAGTGFLSNIDPSNTSVYEGAYSAGSAGGVPSNYTFYDNNFMAYCGPGGAYMTFHMKMYQGSPNCALATTPVQDGTIPTKYCDTFSPQEAIDDFFANTAGYDQTCDFSLDSTPDTFNFDNPVNKIVDMQTDTQGKFYTNPDGSRVPVHPLSITDANAGYLEQTGNTRSFASDLWGIAPNKPISYDHLNYEGAIEQANFNFNGSVPGDINYDADYVINNNTLP